MMRLHLAHFFLWLYWQTGFRWTLDVFGAALPANSFDGGENCGEGEPF